MPKVDEHPASHISLLTCYKFCYWIRCSQGFRRKFVKKSLNEVCETGVSFNDPFCSDGHLGYYVHARGDPEYFAPTCALPGGQVIQPPLDCKPNIFNTIYWRKCDGTYRNALNEKLVNPDGTDRTHALHQVRLGDVIVPRPEWKCPEEYRVAHEKDLATYEKLKDSFVVRCL